MSAGPRVKAIPWLSALPADAMPVRAMVTTAAQAEAEIVERGYCVLRGVDSVGFYPGLIMGDYHGLNT